MTRSPRDEAEHPYVELYHSIGLSPLAAALAAGRHRLDAQGPIRGGGFPPALLPLTWTDSGILRGYWRHWFVPQRRPTIVEFYGQTRFGRPLLAMELARNLDQLLCIELVREVSSGELSEASQRLAAEADIRDLDEMIEMADAEGDDLPSLLRWPLFRDDPPQSCFDDLDSYPGDFPRASVAPDRESLERSCAYEVHSRFRNGLPDLRYRREVAGRAGSPSWLRTVSQSEVFRHELNAGNLAGAWLSLNSIGWTFAAAREAIKLLADRGGDPLFSGLAAAWASLPHEDRMGDSY